uniref:Uncharacterized protein n=1 Tax=Anguilla anguilla TaxID=7936 RepID=A0A0E9WKR7_ANGAN
MDGGLNATKSMSLSRWSSLLVMESCRVCWVSSLLRTLVAQNSSTSRDPAQE